MKQRETTCTIGYPVLDFVLLRPRCNGRERILDGTNNYLDGDSSSNWCVS